MTSAGDRRFSKLLGDAEIESKEIGAAWEGVWELQGEV